MDTKRENTAPTEAGEEGRGYAYGGGSLVAIVLLVLLLIWIL